MYVKVNYEKELKKAVEGKKTKIPVELVICLALSGYPRLERLAEETFGITTW
jgi:hypothetical protein